MNYVFYLRSEISSQHLNSSQDTSPYRFTLKFDIKFKNLSRRDLRLENANLNLRRESVKFKPARSVATSHVVEVGGSLRGKGATS